MPKKRKPGRPPTEEGARPNKVSVLLHDDEKKVIKKAAGDASLSDYLRTAGLEKAARNSSSLKNRKKK